MPNKLGFIANDEEMKKTIEALYPEETRTGDFLIEVLEQDEIVKQGRRLEAMGVRVIIGRSGSYDQNVGNVSVPLLRLRVTTSDILNALVKAASSGKHLSLILWGGVLFDPAWLKLIPAAVDIYRFDDGDGIAQAYQSAVQAQPDSVIVGGGVACTYARRDERDYVFINASAESIIETVNYAKEVMSHLSSIDFEHELLTKTLDSVRDAVIVIDENEIVQLFNERAQHILKVGIPRVLGKRLSTVLPSLGFLAEDLENLREKKEELIHIGSLELTYSTSLVWGDHQIKGLLMSFQDITRLQTLEQKIRRQLNKKGLVARYDFDDIVYSDASMGEMIRKAKKIGKSDSSVVIYGESGTGKELLAQSLHNASDRSQAPFVAINCAALSESILESELFGYEEGAFTGARKGGKPGVFELAHGGTIFLDEINSISQSLQGKLLRVIEEKEVMRLGSDYLIPLDVRVISAANEDLKTMVQESAFRGDLFYRLSSLEVTIPPLRERRSDIEPLFIHFLRDLQMDENIRWPSEEEIRLLTEYHWPGNVRELRNVAERYILFDEIELSQPDESSELPAFDDSLDLKDLQRLVEERVISQLLKSGLSKNEIADKLGISRATLWNKIKK